MTIDKNALRFLSKLKDNNNRNWFNQNKPTFKEHENQVKLFFASLEADLNQSDDIDKHKVFRIYRDIRFSKDKTPFKHHFSGYFLRRKPALRGSYFLKIEPGGNSMAGGGFYGPNKDDLLRIREEFAYDDEPLRKILNAKKFKSTFGTLQGERLKTAPRGFDPSHPANDLISMKQFYAFKQFTDKEVVSANFSKQVIDTFKTLRPYFDYMSEVLTTNSNGESII